MRKLKTLKDFSMDYATGKLQIGKRHPVRVIDVEELRQEAIRWIKWFREEEKKNPQLKLCWEIARNPFEIFFNITEEDLK